MREVSAHRSLGAPQNLSDFRVRLSFGDEYGDLRLARRQLSRIVRAGAVLRGHLGVIVPRQSWKSTGFSGYTGAAVGSGTFQDFWGD